MSDQYTDVYDHSGPFVTVYLDASRTSEAGAREVDLRWRALRGGVAGSDGGAAVLRALDDAVAADQRPGRHGLVLVAAGDRVVFTDHLPAPPVREFAVVAPLPHLMPYLVQRGHRVSYLVVVADRTGADIAEPPWLGGRVTSVNGHSGFPVHKTGRDDWSELHFQHRVENAWESNTREAADAIVRRAAAARVELVVLAGDPRARSLLREELSQSLREHADVVETEHGTRADGGSAESLEDAVHDAVLHRVWRKRRELLEHLQQNLGRHEYAVAGVAGVVGALRRAAVDTLVVSDDPSSTLRAHIGPEPVHIALTEAELRDLGVADPQEDRLDAALVRAAAGTGARLVTTPNAHDYLDGGIGALLRYDVTA